MKPERYTVQAPFRLDLVMGGVCDLDWWSDQPGDCLSISCNFNQPALCLDISCVPGAGLRFLGFGQNEAAFTISRDAFDTLKIENYPDDYGIVIGSILSWKKHFSGIQNMPGDFGLAIENRSTRAKGMGGSTAIASCIITALSKLFGNAAISCDDLIRCVMRAEQLAGIGGGWEDVTGIYYPGINWVTHRPLRTPALEIAHLDIPVKTLMELKDNLLIFDSGIPSSTSKILSSARRVFDSAPGLVRECTESIRNECGVVQNALLNEDFREIGKSLTRQRNFWKTITGQLSASKNIDKLLEPVKHSISGYREAGAGGGGTVLVMAEEGGAKTLVDHLAVNSLCAKPWEIASYGIQITEGGAV